MNKLSHLHSDLLPFPTSSSPALQPEKLAFYNKDSWCCDPVHDWGRHSCSVVEETCPALGMDGMTHTQDSLHYLHKEQHKLCKPSQESKKRKWRRWCKGGEHRCVVFTWCKRQVIFLLHCCRLSKWELSAGSYRRTSFQLKWSEQKTNNKQFYQ